MARNTVAMAKSSDHDESQAVQAAVESVSLDADDLLRKAGVYYVWGLIESGSLKSIHQDVLLKHYLGPKKFNQPVQLIINSQGGDADETTALIDLLGNIRLRVATTGFGVCASAGAMLLASGTKGLRTIAKNALVCVHVYSWGSAGNHHDLVAHRKAEDAEYAKDLDFWLKHSKYRSPKEVKKHLLKREDNWLTAEEAVAHGIVDRIGSVLR